jgi:hypothetical protein
VYVGAAVPRTGTYAVQGEDELKGFELAVEHINTGHELIRKIAPKISKGVRMSSGWTLNAHTIPMTYVHKPAPAKEYCF